MTIWFRERVGTAKGRIRRIAIVAVARKLLIALWRYLERGAWPEGAQDKDWRLLVDSTARRHAKAAAVLA